MKFLIYGGTGWIGGKLIKLFQEDQEEYAIGKARIENRNEILRDIETFKPTHVFHAAGVTGRPNVDWCETHKEETIRANVIGNLNVADICHQKGIHCTIFATGCIYEYDERHPMYGGTETSFKEEETPNFCGSFYSRTKCIVEQLLMVYDNLCILRLRMPISDDLHPRNFITKILNYEKVVNIPNSMSVLTDLLPISIYLSKKRTLGCFNFTNPGAISHNEILQLYQQYIDPTYVFENFSIEEQNSILKARRSNNELNCSKLLKAIESSSYKLPHIQESIHLVFERMKINLMRDRKIQPKHPDPASA